VIAVHELGLCQAIVDATLSRARGRRVTALRVRIGGHVVDEAAVRQGVQVAAIGTPAEGARVDLLLEPMELHCPGCGNTAPVSDHMALIACPRCGGLDIRLSGDDQVLLESIAVQASDEPSEVP